MTGRAAREEGGIVHLIIGLIVLYVAFRLFVALLEAGGRGFFLFVFFILLLFFGLHLLRLVH